MINAQGETIWTNSEIAYELGISPGTVNACAKRLFGYGTIPHWNYKQVKLILEYIKSISVEEDARRLSMLHDLVNNVFDGTKLDDKLTRKAVDKDIHKKVEG